MRYFHDLGALRIIRNYFKFQHSLKGLRNIPMPFKTLAPVEDLGNVYLCDIKSIHR